MREPESDVSTLNIHSLHALYLIPSDHPSPDAVRAKLDGIVRRELSDAVASAVSRSLPDSAPDIWLIRSLKLDADLNLDTSDEQLALTWAKQTATSLVTILDGHADANEVLHFSDRAAYLARFLLDLADGSAWGKWYYRAFEGLRPLPLSAALRTAICHQPAAGRNALLQLRDRGLRRIVASLSEQDAKWILNEISEEDSTSEQALGLERINPRLLNDVLPLENENRAALSFYLRICSEYSRAAAPKLKAFVLAVICLVRCIRHDQSSRSTRLLRALSSSDLASLYQLAGPADAGLLTPLLGRTAEWLQAVGQPLQIARRASDNIDGPRYTASGGIFLLLPLLDAMPIAEGTLGWPEMQSCAPASLVRWLLLMKISGAAGAAQVFRDPLTRDLLGITPEMDPTFLRQWQASLSPKQLFSFQNEIARWQMENWTETRRTFTLLVVRRQPRSVLCCDGQNRSLLLALLDSRSSRDLLLDTVSTWSADHITASADEPATAAELQMQKQKSSRPAPSPLFGPPMDEAHVQQLLDDLDFLQLPPALRGPQRSELTFSVASRALLRDFSWRLPGFSQSGLEYLHRNFLDVHASFQNQAAQRTVRLAQSPLHVVLSLSGMNRQRYGLSWAEGTFALFPE